MQIDAQEVIDSLTAQIGQMNTELTMQKLGVMNLTAENTKLKELLQAATPENNLQLPIEGTVI